MMEFNAAQAASVFTAPALEPDITAQWNAWKRSWLWIAPAMLLTVGAFDLALTISAFEAGRLVEMNPFAAAALAHGGSSALAVYRLVMTIAGCVLLRWGLHAYRLRRFARADFRRVRVVVWGSQVALIVSHLGLVGWWLLWLSA